NRGRCRGQCLRIHPVAEDHLIAKARTQTGLSRRQQSALLRGACLRAVLRECGYVSSSLRAKRHVRRSSTSEGGSNPGWLRGYSMDCFVRFAPRNDGADEGVAAPSVAAKRRSLVPRGGIEPSPIQLKILYFSNGDFPVYLPVDLALYPRPGGSDSV